ncbi:hypothetical protein BDV27DRAFT_171665 [Aspergillus caelatus]|uniref:Fusaric acid resistance protein-like-domain-containing protein n=2 Tax=Aspergillus subgen. Circumdati TaxID=2720871 RepID=A0A5N7AJ69_9EURO|nr:uncharacterized protein BDV27DRAFT_171665 [Aspergillus caelatus]KAE8369932.1 hypothetical protein BDV27DRAFT_171665 [Aspergillus caelatus]KAE8419523.1 hypothetical protein BDV36DRAFT_251154 [Aspergillus pseudocaelatus]
MSQRPPQATVDSNANDATPKKSFRLPAILDHFNARELKVFFRCWVALWVASLLIFITPSLTSIGTATFFASLVLLFNPPSGIVFIYLLGALTLFIGICLAWAWGVITMKAAYAARPAADTQARLASLQQTAVAQANATGSPTASVAQQLIYDGYMLDTRVTAITFCLICTFIYFMARLRASNPKATLTSIFGIIISDLFLNFTPLLPSFSGTLPLTLVKPAAIGVGLGFACSVLFFPRSTSHVVLDSMEDIVELLKQPLTFTSVTLGKKAQQPDVDRLHKTHARIIQEYRKMEPGLAFLPLDFSVGRWGPEEVASFKEPMRQVVAAILLLLEFHIGRIYGEVRTEDILREHAEQTKEALITDEKQPRKVGAQQLSQLAEVLEGLRSPDSQELPQEVVDELVSMSAMAIDACLEGLAVTKECIHMVNCRRWVRRASPTEREDLYQRSQTALENLRKAHSGFLRDMTELLIGHFAPTTNGEPRDQRKLGALVVGMVFEEHVCITITRTEALLARVSTAFHDSKGTQLWWPTSLRYAASWAFRKKAKAPTTTTVVEDDPDEAEDLTKAAQEKLRISRGYRPKHRSPLGRAILGTYHWVTSNEGLFALRMVVVTIALGIPGVIPHTAGFYYREKGLWGLIMAQTGLLVYMSEFTFSTLSRLVGTIAGGVLGLLAWYIGSANGPGNPYGLSAVLAVMLAILIWIRLYLPPSLLQGGIMGGATFMLVVAYSYDDTHIPQYGNPGVGYTVFWRRLLLVLIGVGAATIVQLFPRPPSAARHICKTLSHTVRTLSDHYALLLSCWGRSRHDGRVLAEPISLQLTEGLVMLDGPIDMLRFDFSSSRFDSESLGRVKRLCHIMNRSLGQLLLLSGTLPSEFQHRLAQQTALLDHQCIGEIMAVLGMCEQALKTGDALPEILPTPLVRRAFDYWQSHPAEIDFSPDTVRDENYRRFCVALSAYLKFLGTIDELVLVIKGVLGEAHLVSHELGNLV